MMSNHARAFNHITFNTTKPLKTSIGNFEWQLITGKLKSSGYNPPNTDYEYAGTKLFVPKINQLLETDDWRFMQGYTLTYSPKWISGLSIGFIRWVQMYSALIKGKYTWMEGNISWLPIFNNFLRKNDKYENYEAQTDQGAGVFLRWLWKDSKAEIYAEFHYNDAKQNVRDLLLDSDHSRAVTIGLQKNFKIKNDDFLFSWEWTQMEQNASSLIRYTGSWYEHIWSFDGYTNNSKIAIKTVNNIYFLEDNNQNKLIENDKLNITYIVNILEIEKKTKIPLTILQYIYSFNHKYKLIII